MNNLVEEIVSNNLELDIDSIVLSDHALLRMKQRFNISDKQKATETVKEWLRHSLRIGKTSDENGKDSIMYLFGKTEIYILPDDLKTVLTIIRSEKEYKIYSPFKNKIIEMHMKEFDKLDRMERSTEKEVKLRKLQISVEIAQLELRKEKTRYESVRRLCEKELSSKRKLLKELDEKIGIIKGKKRQIGKSIVSIM